MKWLQSVLVMATIVGMSPSYAKASGVLYECDLPEFKRASGWVSPKVALVLPGDGSVSVVDAVILDVHRTAFSGTIVRENANRLIVKWTLNDLKTISGRSFANFDYRMSISKLSGNMELTANPRELTSGLRSNGSCIARKK